MWIVDTYLQHLINSSIHRFFLYVQTKNQLKVKTKKAREVFKYGRRETKKSIFDEASNTNSLCKKKGKNAHALVIFQNALVHLPATEISSKLNRAL